MKYKKKLVMTHSLTNQLSGLCLEQTVEISVVSGCSINQNSKFKLSVDCGLLGQSFTKINNFLYRYKKDSSLMNLLFLVPLKN